MGLSIALRLAEAGTSVAVIEANTAEFRHCVKNRENDVYISKDQVYASNFGEGIYIYNLRTNERRPIVKQGAVDMYPFEVQAGNDIVAIRKQYPTLRIMGGINKLKISQGKVAIDKELDSKVPFMLSQGGYVPYYFDHFVHPDVSWEDFRYYRTRLREMIEADADKR